MITLISKLGNTFFLVQLERIAFNHLINGALSAPIGRFTKPSHYEDRISIVGKRGVKEPKLEKKSEGVREHQL